MVHKHDSPNNYLVRVDPQPICTYIYIYLSMYTHIYTSSRPFNIFVFYRGFFVQEKEHIYSIVYVWAMICNVGIGDLVNSFIMKIKWNWGVLGWITSLSGL